MLFLSRPQKHITTVLSSNLFATSFFYSQQFPNNSASFSGRDLESVSRLSGGPSYFVLVIVAQLSHNMFYSTLLLFLVATSKECLDLGSFLSVSRHIEQCRDLVSLSRRRLCSLKSLSLSLLITRMSGHT